MPYRPHSHAERLRAQLPAERDDRPSAALRGYGRRWQRLRGMQLSREPLCRECAKHGETVPATDVDHVMPLSEGGSNGLENLQSLCHGCHSAKTRRNGR